MRNFSEKLINADDERFLDEKPTEEVADRRETSKNPLPADSSVKPLEEVAAFLSPSIMAADSVRARLRSAEDLGPQGAVDHHLRHGGV